MSNHEDKDSSTIKEYRFHFDGRNLLWEQKETSMVTSEYPTSPRMTTVTLVQRLVAFTQRILQNARRFLQITSD